MNRIGEKLLIGLFVTVATVGAIEGAVVLASNGTGDIRVNIHNTKIIHIEKDDGEYPDVAVFCSDGYRLFITRLEEGTSNGNTYPGIGGGGVSVVQDNRCKDYP